MAKGKGTVEPIPLRAMERFNHKGVCVSPETNIVYQTEDRCDSLIYRFLPNEPSDLQPGRVLQALVVNDQPGLDTHNWESSTITINQLRTNRWMTLRDIVPDEEDLRFCGHVEGAVWFAWGEGMLCL